MIRLENITKKYGEEYALKNCSITFPDKGFVSIVGESGSGKTTLLNIMGMLESGYEGHVLFDGAEYQNDEERSSFRLNNISYIFQDSLMIPYLSVMDNLLLQPGLEGKKTDEAGIRSLAEYLNVSSLLTRKINELSGGQKQRLAILRALVSENGIVLADEPTGNLDSESAVSVFETLKNVSLEKLVVVVTHDLKLAEQYSDRIITISKGEITSNDMNYENKGVTRHENISKAEKTPLFWKLIKGDVKNKPKIVRKMISGIFFATMVASICVTFGISVIISNRNNEMFILETDLLEISELIDKPKNVRENMAVMMNSLAGDYSEYENDKRFEEVTFSYLVPLHIFTEKEIISIVNYEIIDDNDFYHNKMRAMEIIGEVPQNGNEVILSYEAAKKAFPGGQAEKCIGKTVSFGTSEVQIPMLVVGINCRADMDGDVNTFILEDTFRLLNDAQKNTPAQKRCNIFTNLYFEKHPEFFGGNSYFMPILEFKCFDADTLENDRILYGRNVENDGEIVLGLNYILNSKEQFSVQTEEETKALIGTEVACGNTFKRVLLEKIVGIAEDTEKEKFECFLSGNDIIRLQEYAPASVRLYAKKAEMIPELEEEMLNKGFIVKVPYFYLQDSIGRKFEGLAIVVFILGISVFLSSSKSVGNLIKGNVDQSLNDIGLLRTMGLNSMEVGRMYLMESLFIAFRSFIIAAITFPLVMAGLNALNKAGIMSFVSIDTIGVAFGFVGLLLFPVVAAFLASKPAMNKIGRLNIISLVRNIEK